MTVSMYQISAPIFIQFLTSLSDVLGKAAIHAETRKIDPATLINMRLFPDMYTLAQQVQHAILYAVSGMARPAGVERPDLGPPDTDIAGLRARIGRAIDFIAGLAPERMDGTDQTEVVIDFHGAPKAFSAQSYLLNFCIPSFYFHCTTAYAILRHCGVELGKADFMGTPSPIGR